jgi:hypothetical protein
MLLARQFGDADVLENLVVSKISAKKGDHI